MSQPRKVKRIYDSTGYLNFDTLWGYNLFLTFVIGARGIGKTFNALRYCITHGINTIYVRRTKEECDIASGRETNVLTEIVDFCGYTMERIEGAEMTTYRVFRSEGEYCDISFSALTTFHKIRSIGLQKYDCILYDEFIPEKIARRIKNEADAFNNMIETVNRNRELKGQSATKVFCLSNSNNIYNEILAFYNLIPKLTKMQQNKDEIFIDRERSIGLIYPLFSPISEAKKQTALYKALGDTDYGEMALYNNFDQLPDYPFIKSQPLKEYTPKISIGDLTIYEHKSDFKCYITFHYSGSVRKLEVNTENMKQFRKLQIGKMVIATFFIHECYFENIKAFMLWKNYSEL